MVSMVNEAVFCDMARTDGRKNSARRKNRFMNMGFKNCFMDKSSYKSQGTKIRKKFEC